ncbi:Secreted RxLR effector peptide protein [Phytophthora palmivora]|uniref:Secreted RxLR effector peptide protein n=1 Tax=Phytophthora palmivora TaxID=4796 RepID=A0A2P4YIH8_9STRA|nr:Secreted RxLR effector peptide protein [Phytophthora palmivora]
MKLHYYGLWISSILVASVDATSRVKLVSPSMNHPEPAIETVAVPLERSLRVNEEWTTENEERGVGTGLAETAKSIFTPSVISPTTIKRWLDSQKSPIDAFKRLQLNFAGASLFRKPKFNTWVEYMRKLNADNPEEAMFKVLRTSYTDKALSRMLIGAKRGSDTDDIITKLQAEQLRYWASKEKSTDDVFNLLQLNKVDDKLFNNPEFLVWAKYVGGVKTSGKESTMISTLLSHYSDDALSQMLIAAKKAPKTKSIATDLQAEQLRIWLSKEKFTDEVFTLLRLDQLKSGADKIFDNPEFLLWSKYLDDLNIPHKEQTMLSTLSASYSDEIVTAMITAAKTSPGMESMATKMANLQTKTWLNNNKSPVDVFKFYQLDKAGDSLLTSPQLNIWINYMNKFNDQNPTEKVTMLSAFTKYYDDGKLAKILIAGKGVPSTEKLATDLQKAQIQGWLETRKKTADVGKWLGEDVTNPSPLFQDFMKKSISQALAPRRSG